MEFDFNRSYPTIGIEYQKGSWGYEPAPGHEDGEGFVDGIYHHYKDGYDRWQKPADLFLVYLHKDVDGKITRKVSIKKPFYDASWKNITKERLSVIGKTRPNNVFFCSSDGGIEVVTSIMERWINLAKDELKQQRKLRKK